jgi:hypothetical protein
VSLWFNLFVSVAFQTYVLICLFRFRQAEQCCIVLRATDNHFNHLATNDRWHLTLTILQLYLFRACQFILGGVWSLGTSF